MRQPGQCAVAHHRWAEAYHVGSTSTREHQERQRETRLATDRMPRLELVEVVCCPSGEATLALRLQFGNIARRIGCDAQIGVLGQHCPLKHRTQTPQAVIRSFRRRDLAVADDPNGLRPEHRKRTVSEHFLGAEAAPRDTAAPNTLRWLGTKYTASAGNHLADA